MHARLTLGQRIGRVERAVRRRRRELRALEARVGELEAQVRDEVRELRRLVDRVADRLGIV